MKTLRAIPIIFALIAFCATGGALAEDESPPTRVAQAQEAAPSGDNRPATLGDLRYFESRVDDRMARLEERMVDMFLALLFVMIMLFGLPHIPDWWNRLRANGKPATIAGVFLVAAVVLTAGVAIAGKF